MIKEKEIKEMFLFGEVNYLTCEEVLMKYRNIAKNKAYTYSMTGIYEYEDLFQCCLIGIWKAYKYYKMPYNFYGIAIKFMKYEMLNHINKMKKYKDNVVSLEESVFTNKNGDEIPLIDTLGEEDKIIASYAETDIARRLLDALSERQRDEIISLNMDEYKRKEMADKYHVSYQKFNERAKVTINRFRMLFIKEEAA